MKVALRTAVVSRNSSASMGRCGGVWRSARWIIGLAMGSSRLGTGLWFDEIITLVDFVRLPTAELVRTFSSFNNHVLYSLEAQAAIALFGETAWALRLPAMLFGVAGVAALWWFGRQIVSVSEA